MNKHDSTLKIVGGIMYTEEGVATVEVGVGERKESGTGWRGRRRGGMVGST